LNKKWDLRLPPPRRKYLQPKQQEMRNCKGSHRVEFVVEYFEMPLATMKSHFPTTKNQKCIYTCVIGKVDICGWLNIK
jgi:hypothetical protein